MKPDRQTERRQAILAAAGPVFARKGYESTTTLDIATAAGMSKRDLYAHFASKDQIVAGLVTSGVERFSAPVEFTAPHSRTEVLAVLAGFTRGFLTFLISPEPVGLYRLAITTADRDPAPGRALLTEGVDGTIQRITAYVAAAAEAGHLAIAAGDVAPAVNAFLSTAIGRLQMERLLTPADLIAPGRIDANADAALRVLLLFEQAQPGAIRPPSP